MGGDNIGMNIKGLDKQNMPRSGDVMVYKKDTSLGACDNFDAQIQVLDIPGEIKIGYSPIGFVRCGRSACRSAKMNWKIGKETGGKNGGSAFAQVQRDGGGELRPAAAACGRHVQELRGSLSHCFPRRQRRCYARKDREEDGQGREREEEVDA